MDGGVKIPEEKEEYQKKEPFQLRDILLLS